MGLSHSIQFHVILQFRKLTEFLWYSLKTLNGVLGTGIEDKYKKYILYHKIFEIISILQLFCYKYIVFCYFCISIYSTHLIFSHGHD